MSDEREDRGWTLLLLRDGAVGSHAWRLSRGKAGVLVGAAVVLLLATGVGAGLWWAGLGESQKVTRLQMQVQRLAEERSRVLSLAAKLDSLEGEYRRLRKVMGGEEAASERDIQLPPSPGGVSAREALRSARDVERYAWPLAQQGFVTRSYGEARAGESSGHPGMDVAVPTGSYVRATRDGVVAEAGDDAVYGRYVRLQHADAVSSLYGHNAWIFVQPGDTVESGEVIALSGNSGRSTAPHLHFEVKRGDKALDPIALLRGSG